MSLLLNPRFFAAAFIPLYFSFMGWNPAFSQQEVYSSRISLHSDPWKPLCPLPRKINETSGLIFFDAALWTFNDSGGKPEIYEIHPSDGRILRTVILKGADNQDWEDICQDDESIYIGDFGNNRGNRKDLKVYKIRKQRIVAGIQTTLEPEVIRFTYRDQSDFSTRNRSHNFDCEAIVHYNGTLLLFSKNWIDAKTRMYRLPVAPGDYVLDPVAEFNTDGLVTAAEIDPGSRHLFLLGYSNWVPFIWVIPSFEGTFPGENEPYWRIDFPGMVFAQTEGIAVMENGQLAVSTEKTDVHKQAIYVIDRDLLMNPSNPEKTNDKP
jgi:hypothetical protein